MIRPSQYYEWCMRLKKARNNLKNTYKSVDEHLAFYKRSSFEDLEEKEVVARAQKYLSRIGVGMTDYEVALMLQKAADGVCACLPPIS